MKRIRALTILLLFISCTISYSLSAYADNGDTVVYITRTGECYHNDGCSYLKSKIEISLSEAVSAGYRPCSRCHPPKLDETISSFHLRPIYTANPNNSSTKNNGTKVADNKYSAVKSTNKNGSGYSTSTIAGVSVASFLLGGHFVKKSEEKRKAQQRASARQTVSFQYSPQNDNMTPTQMRLQPTQPTTVSHISSSSSPSKPHCPKCGSTMILRNGPYGRFYGCSNYPRCRGTRNYKQ